MNTLDAFRNGLITRDEYSGFLKGNIIKCVLECEKSDDPIDGIDSAMNYLYELYYLLGSEQLDMSIDGFRELSELTHAREQLK